MKHKTRILTLRTLSVLILVALLAALSPPALHTGGVALAQTGPTLTATATGPTSIQLSWSSVSTADSYRLIRWTSGQTNWSDVVSGHTTTTYDDDGLTAGARYYYKVTAVTGTSEGPWSETQNAVPGSLGVPMLSITAGTGQIDLTWTSVTAAVSYNLITWTSGQASWADIGGAIKGTSYTHDNLTPGTTHFYQVRAVNAANTRSDWSNQLSATVIQRGPPPVPTSLKAAFGNQNVTLTWAAPASDGGSAIIRYEYRYAQSSGTLPDSWIGVGLALTANIAGLTNGTEYDFEVRAVNDQGDGEAATASAIPATVSIAPNLSATAGYRQITLNWDAPTNNGGADVTSYRIEVFRNGSYAVETTVAGTVLTYRDIGLSDNTQYDYQIIAINKAGDSPPDTASATTVATSPTAPSVPLPGTAPVADPGPGMVTINWNPPAFNSQTVTRYEFRSARDADEFSSTWASAGADPGETSLEVKNLTPGTPYKFQVRARNSAGVSPELDIGPATPQNTVPTAAPSIAVSAVDLTTDDDPANDGVAHNLLTWNELSSMVDGDGNPTGDSIISSYTIQWKSSRSATGTDTTDWPDDDAEVGDVQVMTENADTADANNGVFEVTHEEIANNSPILPGTTYDYRVRAVNPIGGGDWSTVRSITTAIVVPDAPGLANSGSTAFVADASSIIINWTAPADTGGAPILYYEILVSSPDAVEDDNTTADVNELEEADATISNVPILPTTYMNTGLSPAIVYHYRVRAVNSAGKGPWSEDAMATTSAAEAAAPGTPGAPTNLQFSGTDANRTVTWTAPTDRGNTPILTYQVQYRQEASAADAAVLVAAVATVWDDATIDSVGPPPVTSYAHNGLPGGVWYAYRVRAVNSSGPGAWSTQDVNEIAARSPDAPVLTAIPNGKTEILLEWTVPAGNGADLEDYDLQRWDPDTDDGEWTNTDLLGTDDTLVTLFLDTGRTAGTTYYYRVNAENSVAPAGGAFSTVGDPTMDTASATTDTDVPVRVVWGRPASNGNPAVDGAVPGTVVGTDDDTITLTWTAPATGGLDITGYEIRVWDGSQWVSEATPAAADDTYKDTGLTHGAMYHYVIRASNSQGAGPWSTSISATVTTATPEMPVLTARSGGQSTIILEWTMPNNNGASITDYDLQRWNNETDAWPADTVDLLDDASTATLFTDGTGDAGDEDGPLASGMTFYYRIRAANGAADTNEGEWSAINKTDAATATTDQAVPATPELNVGSGDDAPTETTIMVTWPAPDDNGSDITRYELQVWDGANRRWVHESYPADDATSYTDTGLSPGKTYYYRIRAWNGEGAGGWSQFVDPLTLARKPGLPTLIATAISTTEIRLTWSVADDGGSPITDYNLQKWDYDTNNDNVIDSSDMPDWADDANEDLLGTDDSTATFHIDTEGNGPGTVQHYRIQAVNMAGGSDNEGDWTTAVSVQTIAGVPDRPVLTSLPLSSTQIQLSWTEPSANGSPIDHYELEVWDRTNKSWSRIGGNLRGPDRRYTNSGLTADTTYVYRIRAVNGAPGNNGQGQWSTMINGTTNE